MEEGVVYKIDMRLRPSGNAGPLVTSLDSFCDYHQTSAELWERQALIKARFVAGDRDLGKDTERAAETTTYGEGLPKDGIEKINHLRMRMERELAGESDSRFNLKKGKGVVDGLELALKEFKADLLVGLDVGGDSLAQGGEKGLRSPLADSVMLAASAELEKQGVKTLWGVFGYGSDGE